MCRPRAPKDNSAEIARQQEAARQARISEGQTAIDNQFANFNDDFFTGYQNQYLDYYTPQLTDQYDDAVERLTLDLARTGNLTGSAGARQLADLQKFYDQQKTSITGRALDAANQLRGSVDSRKSQLYTDNRAAADPGNATSAAASAAQALQPVAPSSPLANVFGDFFSNLGNTNAIRNTQRLQQGTGVQNFGGGSSGGGSSAFYVN